MRINYATDSVVIREDLDKVFNFISRGAQYERWHFDYHLRSEAMDIREGGVGSVFSIEEIIDGFYLHHVGHVVEFVRNKRFVWLGRFAMFSWIWIGTDLTFTKAPEGTRVKEILYFKANPLLLPFALLYIWRKAFRPAACKAHVLDEMSGVKRILESGDYDPSDVTYALEDEELMSQVKRYRDKA
ncbi:MAG: SRPBCC domain-containing protein [Proteobacteria bacterium]|nr:SRPBCC domain-containing protein [Pseudomonadota bacterium]